MPRAGSQISQDKMPEAVPSRDCLVPPAAQLFRVADGGANESAGNPSEENFSCSRAGTEYRLLYWTRMNLVFSKLGWVSARV